MHEETKNRSPPFTNSISSSQKNPRIYDTDNCKFNETSQNRFKIEKPIDKQMIAASSSDQDCRLNFFESHMSDSMMQILINDSVTMSP